MADKQDEPEFGAVGRAVVLSIFLGVVVCCIGLIHNGARTAILAGVGGGLLFLAICLCTVWFFRWVEGQD